MATTTERFFEGLAGGAARPVLGSARGSIRFDVRDGRKVSHWRVVLSRGTATAERSAEAADCVVALDATVMDRLTGGHANALTTLLRGEVQVEGKPGPLVHFQRLFPVADHPLSAGSARTVGRKRG